MGENIVFEQSELPDDTDWGRQYIGDSQAVWQKVIDIDRFIEHHRIPDETEQEYRETGTNPVHEVRLLHEHDIGYTVRIRFSTGPGGMKPIANYTKTGVGAAEALKQVEYLLDEY